MNKILFIIALIVFISTTCLLYTEIENNWYYAYYGIVWIFSAEIILIELHKTKLMK